MKEIVVLSGKGGVGKSSLTAALGHLFAEEKKYRVTLADTDVDAPNLHLVFGADFESSQGVQASDKAFIDYDLCSNCMACVDACKFSSIISTDEPVMVNYSCEGCGACVLSCPAEAITVKPVENGKINTAASGSIRIISGELGIGESSSGHLVDAVKQKARQKAALFDSDILLTDGPPGIGCPVIASLKGAHYVLLVTEPTPSALSDLKRVAEVVNFSKLPAGVILNRANMHYGAKKVLLSWLEESNLPLLAEIPYDSHLPEALAQGKLAVSIYPEAPASVAIRELCETIDILLTGE